MTEATNTNIHRAEDVRVLLKDLLKVIKVISMYPENNPLPQSLRRTFAERLVDRLELCGELAIAVDKDHLEWNNETVFIDKSKEENLAGLFFDTGITGLTFGPSMDEDQVYAFLDIIKAYMNAKGQRGDLVQTLWERSLPNFSFTTVEDVQLAEYQGNLNVDVSHSHRARGHGQPGDDGYESYDAIFVEEIPDSAEACDEPVDDDPSHPRPPTPNRQGRGQMFYALNTGQGQPESTKQGVDEVTFRAAEAAMGLGFGNMGAGFPTPNTTIILNDELKLTEEDEQCIVAMCAEDAQIDMYESTLELLKEMLLQESELPDFGETVTICEKMHSEFVRAGKLSIAGALNEHVSQLEEQLRPERPVWADRLKEARLAASGRERLHLLAETLNKFPEISSADLRQYLNLFGWEAVGFLADLLGNLEVRIHRECLCDYLAERGQKNLPLVAKGMFDKRWFVVRNTVDILARIGSDMALNYIKRAADHEEVRVRMELANVMSECPNPCAIDILRRLVTDPEPSIRSAVIGALLSKKGPKALETIKSVIHDVRFSTLDPEERQLVLSAYAIMGGDEAMTYLLGVINKMSFWKDQEQQSNRETAMNALAHSPDPKADEALLRLSQSWRPAIKHAAVAALKLRREVKIADTNR